MSTASTWWCCASNVAIDNPKGITQFGGTVSAPIAKSILTDAITALDIEKPEGGLDKIYQWYEQKYYRLPNVVGMSVSDAKKELKNFQIEYTGSGDIVKSMSPEADSQIAEGSTVRLMLGNWQANVKCDKLFLVVVLKYDIMYM